MHLDLGTLILHGDMGRRARRPRARYVRQPKFVERLGVHPGVGLHIGFGCIYCVGSEQARQVASREVCQADGVGFRFCACIMCMGLGGVGIDVL